MAAGSRSGVFVGRGHELAVLRGLVADLAAGRGRAVFVEGEPGIGKSALLAAGLAEARSLGLEVLEAAADELGQRFPLQVMLDCLGVEARSADPRRAEIARALRGERGDSIPLTAVGAGATDPVVAVERLLALVDELCAAAPVVLVVDDLQWADDASLLVWHRLALAVHQLPLLLAGAARPVPRRPELAPLLRGLASRDGVLISLGPLAADDVSALVGALVGAPPGPRLQQRTEQAAGNPLYVREMVDTLLREDAVRIEGGRAEPAEQEPAVRAPRSLAAAIVDRLGFLSADAVSVLRMAALLGNEFSVPELAVVARWQPSDLLPVTDEAAAAGVLDASGPQLRFRHALIRQALYEAIPVAMRQALHRQAAEAMAAAGAPAERVAQQLLPFVDSADAWMLGWLTEAAPALIHRAPQIAADLLERAIETAPADDPRRETLEASLAAVSFLLARHDRLEWLARQVLAKARDPERVAEMTWLLGYTLLRLGRYDEAIAAVRLALDGPTLGEIGRARIFALEALVLANCGRDADAAVAVRRAAAEGERVGDRFAVGYTLQTEAAMHFWRRDVEKCLACIDRALDVIGTDPQTADLRALLLSNRMGGLGALDRVAEADAALHEARVFAERIGTARIGGAQLASAEHFFLTGRWDDAQAELDSVTELPLTQNVPLWRHGLAAVIAAHRDRRDSAAAHLRAVRDQDLTLDVFHNAESLIMARAVVAEQEGRLAEAVAVLTPTLQPDYAEQMTDRYLWLPDLVRLALALGDAPTAEAAAEACAAEAATGFPATVMAAGHARGLLAGDPAPMLVAAEHYRKARRLPQLGWALEDAAVLLAGRGEAGTARAAYGEAIEVYTNLGAEWDIIRADARVRACGIRRGPRRPRRRATTGWAALSPTETKIAYLVAEGRSNPDIGARLFLSRRTVQTHVSHIMAKLGVRSRAEVAREAALHPTPHGDRHPADRGSLA